MRARGRVLLAAATPVAAASLLAACAAGAVGIKRSPGVIESGAFKPTRATAANYGPDPSLTCPERGINELLAKQVESAAKAEGRLCAVAETLLGWEATTGSEVPPDSVLAVISSDFGLPQTARRVVITTVNTAEGDPTSRGRVEGASENDVATMLVEPIRTFASTAQTPRYGAAFQRVKKGLTKLVLVLQDQTLEIQPIPRKLNPGQTATLSGRVLGKLVNPKVQYTDAMGKLEKAEAKSEKSFAADVKCGDRQGRIIVSVAAEQEGADVSLANFPIGCGVDLPVAAAVSAPGGKAVATVADPAAVEKQLAEMINNDRATAGLKPLQIDADLAKVARGLSADRAKGKGTTSEELTRRLQEMEIAAPTILVSEAQALNTEDAYTRFSNSPQDRANAMNAEMTNVGVGVAPGPAVNNQPTLIVSELFLKQNPPPDPEELKANLYSAISRRRSDARAPAVAKDPQLEQIAQAYATQMAKDKGKVSKEKVSEIEAPLYKMYATVNELGGVKSDPLDFAEEPGVV